MVLILIIKSQCTGAVPQQIRALKRRLALKDASSRLRASAGYTIIELMMSMLLGSVLISVAILISLRITKQFEMQKSMDDIEHRAAMITHQLMTDIRLAGYVGCPRLTRDLPIESHTNFLLSDANKIAGTENTLQVIHAAFPSATVIDNEGSRFAVNVDMGQRFKARQLILISDCSHVEMLYIDKVLRRKYSQQILFNTSLSHIFVAGAEVSRVEFNRYSLVGTGVTRSLQRQTIDNRRAIVAEGLHVLHFSYVINAGSILQQRMPQDSDSVSHIIGVNVDFILRVNTIEKPWHLFIPLASA